MKTKICSSFWSDPEIENTTPEVRLAALWLETNDRITLFGYAEFTSRRFEFETGLKSEALAKTFEALAKRYQKTGNGYWVRHYIREQFGDGEALTRNNLFKAIARQLAACSADDVVKLVTTEYPHFVKVPPLPLGKPLPSPTQGQRVRAGEGVRESVSVRAGVSAGARASRRKVAAAVPVSVLPTDQPEPIRHRMLLLNECKHRGEAVRWSGKEFAAFKSAGLDVCTDEEFWEQAEPVKAYYTADLAELRPHWGTKGDRADEDFRRRDLVTLLNNWGGEVDKAQAWCHFVATKMAERGSGRL